MIKLIPDRAKIMGKRGGQKRATYSLIPFTPCVLLQPEEKKHINHVRGDFYNQAAKALGEKMIR